MMIGTPEMFHFKEGGDIYNYMKITGIDIKIDPRKFDHDLLEMMKGQCHHLIPLATARYQYQDYKSAVSSYQPTFEVKEKKATFLVSGFSEDESAVTGFANDIDGKVTAKYFAQVTVVVQDEATQYGDFHFQVSVQYLNHRSTVL
jgi:hypothetical protein